MSKKDTLKLGIAQIAPVWINRNRTIDKIMGYVSQAADDHCDLIVFGEGLLPGYPFWLDRTNGAEFNSKIQKEMHAHYMDQAVCIEEGHLDAICKRAKEGGIAIYLGIIERPLDRGGHSLYCSLVYIDKEGEVKSVHRKLMPTYEERLAWSPGDGHGLITHSLPPFTVGGLNCWENWMPLARTALYAQGEDLHISVWPGNRRNTEDLLPVIAKESRSYVVGVSGLFRPQDIPDDFPHVELMRANTKENLANGGSCLVAPDGTCVVEPFTDVEKLVTAEIHHSMVREERQNFDPVGHYSRPDVLRLQVNKERQGTLE
jgi:nitrilase